MRRARRQEQMEQLLLRIRTLENENAFFLRFIHSKGLTVDGVVAGGNFPRDGEHSSTPPLTFNRLSQLNSSMSSDCSFVSQLEVMRGRARLLTTERRCGDPMSPALTLDTPPHHSGCVSPTDAGRHAYASNPSPHLESAVQCFSELNCLSSPVFRPQQGLPYDVGSAPEKIHPSAVRLPEAPDQLDPLRTLGTAVYPSPNSNFAKTLGEELEIGIKLEPPSLGPASMPYTHFVNAMLHKRFNDRGVRERPSEYSPGSNASAYEAGAFALGPQQPPGAYETADKLYAEGDPASRLVQEVAAETIARLNSTRARSTSRVSTDTVAAVLVEMQGTSLDQAEPEHPNRSASASPVRCTSVGHVLGAEGELARGVQAGACWSPYSYLAF
ncbi:hypothetical protein H632_c81p1 [Helicosporidium sp. ATCC 50920]|nr:hypothetical protein H632_c81p1 [Helicosporidium sp. ATCC 50920]|eukprot:KDD76870.1 hypothetical protein H632_c81p1 [Helicosporidium sp. ATCC 50920]